MFNFAKIIHLDNDKEDYIFKPDKKQEFKSFSITLWNDPQKTKPISSLNFNKFSNKKEETKKVDDYNIDEFKEPKIAEAKYEKFTSSKDVKPYNAEKGRYSNINTEDLLFNANVKDQIANQLDPKIEELKQEIISRISLDDPNQEEHIRLLLEKNYNKIVKNTRTGRAVINKKIADEIKDLQESNFIQGLKIEPISKGKRRKIKRNMKEQDLDLNNDFNEKNFTQLNKDLDRFFKPIEEAKEESNIRQTYREKQRREKQEKIEEFLRKKLKTRQQKKKIEKATEKLQARFRGQRTRLGKSEEGQEFSQEINKIIQAKNERNQQKNKITKIQALARGKQARKKLENLKKEERQAKKIQAVIRGNLARGKAQKLREDIFNKEIENQATQKVRNKKLGIVEPEILQAEPIQAEPLALEQMSENLNKLQNHAFVYLEKFLSGNYTENTFNQKIKLNTLREICKLSNIDYNGKTKTQMIKLIKERLST